MLNLKFITFNFRINYSRDVVHKSENKYENFINHTDFFNSSNNIWAKQDIGIKIPLGKSCKRRGTI